jgi:hypothetical protein
LLPSGKHELPNLTANAAFMVEPPLHIAATIAAKLDHFPGVADHIRHSEELHPVAVVNIWIGLLTAPCASYHFTHLRLPRRAQRSTT